MESFYLTDICTFTLIPCRSLSCSHNNLLQWKWDGAFPLQRGPMLLGECSGCMASRLCSLVPAGLLSPTALPVSQASGLLRASACAPVTSQAQAGHDLPLWYQDPWYLDSESSAPTACSPVVCLGAGAPGWLASPGLRAVSGMSVSECSSLAVDAEERQESPFWLSWQNTP